MFKFIFVLTIASIASAQASEYKKMICNHSKVSDLSHIAEYEEGILYDEITLNYFESGDLLKLNCAEQLIREYGSKEFRGIYYRKAHKTKCSIQDGIYFLHSSRRSSQGHVYNSKYKVNFLTKHHSVGVRVCQPGQNKDCPEELTVNFSCRYAE